MSLVVSLRIPDGIVIAADSLATTQMQFFGKTNIPATCPECRKDIELRDVQMPPVNTPASTFSYAQKLFSFHERFGIGSYGMGIINARTIYYHVKLLEKKLREDGSKVDRVSDAAESVRDYFQSQLREQMPDLDGAPDDFYPLGLQVVGYNDDEAKTMQVQIGKEPKIEPQTGLGCTVGGDLLVVNKLWTIEKEFPQRAVNYGAFSLQDAIDYATFLIDTTADSQRFTSLIPTVGGEVDIALITSLKPFTWIRCKELVKVLEKVNTADALQR